MVALALTLAAGSRPAAAQTSPDAPPSAEPAPPPPHDDILVTGKRVAGSVISSVPPIAVLDSAALRSLGVTSMADVMKRLQGASTSANGGDPAILLNGRRVSGFEDLQSLPPEAIDRVEILPEQEAARFGFPPTMRVMNFITKKHFRSLTLQQLAGTTTEGGGATEYAELDATRIEGPRRASLALSYFRWNPVLQSQRDIRPDPDALFAFPGNVGGIDRGSIDPALDPLAGRPVTIAGIPQDPARRSLSNYVDSPRAVTDLGPFRTLQGSTDTIRLDGTLASPIGKKLDGSLNLSLQADRNVSLNGLAAGILRVPGGSGVLPFTDPTLVYRYFPGIVLRQQNTSLAAHAGVTLQGGLKR